MSGPLGLQMHRDKCLCADMMWESAAWPALAVKLIWT